MQRRIIAFGTIVLLHPVYQAIHVNLPAHPDAGSLNYFIVYFDIRPVIKQDDPAPLHVTGPNFNYTFSHLTALSRQPP
jgi:hypothetical protein